MASVRSRRVNGKAAVPETGERRSAPMSDNVDHGGILDGKTLKEVIAGLKRAEQGDDPDAAYDALAEVGAIVRETLENPAALTAWTMAACA
jgi:hypothetical protein